MIIPQGKLNGLTFREHNNLDNSASTDSWLDILFIPAFFKKGITFKTFSPELKIKSLKLYLSNQEYQLIKDLQQHFRQKDKSPFNC